MFEAQVTQFIVPHGRQDNVSVFLPDNVKVKYHDMVKCGCRLTAEVLLTKEVSLAIEQPELGDYSTEITNNGPSVKLCIERLLEEFDKNNFNDWAKEASSYG